jgi:hypothetical protein
MTRRASITFVEATAPIARPVTKFGGQPLWVVEPAWPCAAKTGERLRFIAPIALEPAVFGDLSGAVAYLFLEDRLRDKQVVLQRAGSRPFQVEPEPGPCLEKSVKTLGGLWSKRVPCEFGVERAFAEDPELVPEEQQAEWDDPEIDAYVAGEEGTKLGGTPRFIQGDGFPEGDGWRLLLQVDASEVPFELDLGDAGSGYVFLSSEGERAEFIWQCY